MKVNVEDRMYDVRFHKSHRGEGKKRVIDTCCVVSIVDPEKKGKERFTEVSVGYSYHNPMDKYSKATGKKWALKRALGKEIDSPVEVAEGKEIPLFPEIRKTPVFTRSERTRFWYTFFSEFRSFPNSIV